MENQTLLNTKIHVGNLDPVTTQTELQVLFSEYGNVSEIHLPLDRQRQRQSGLAVVTMSTPQGAEAAIRALDGKQVGARTLTVIAAPPRSNR